MAVLYNLWDFFTKKYDKIRKILRRKALSIKRGLPENLLGYKQKKKMYANAN